MCSKVCRNLLTFLMLPLIVEALIPPESHHRKSIMREFVFKTESPPPPAHNKLYKAVLKAPRLSPAEETINSVVLSRGEVYPFAKGGWIMCQDGCVNREICEVRRNTGVSTATWTLRRVMSSSRRPYHLQLNPSPRGDDGFREKNTSPGSYIHVTSSSGGLDGFADDLITANKGGSVTTTTGDVRTHMRPGVIPGRKRGREMRGQRPHLVGGSTTPSTLFHPDEESISDDCPVGRDQFGKKRLVYVTKSSSPPETFHPAHLERLAVLDHEDRSSCREIHRRVIDSLNANRAAIEKLLFSSTLDDLTSPSPAAGKVLPVENKPPSSSIDTTRSDDRIEQDNEERIRQVAVLTSVRPKTDIDLPEDHAVAANAHDDSESGSNTNIDPKETLAERNSFGGLSAEGSDGSGSTLILKEVAKSVVDHPSDTLQGFNLLTNTATTTTRY